MIEEDHEGYQKNKTCKPNSQDEKYFWPIYAALTFSCLGTAVFFAMSAYYALAILQLINSLMLSWLMWRSLDSKHTNKTKKCVSAAKEHKDQPPPYESQELPAFVGITQDQPPPYPSIFAV